MRPGQAADLLQLTYLLTGPIGTTLHIYKQQCEMKYGYWSFLSINMLLY